MVGRKMTQPKRVFVDKIIPEFHAQCPMSLQTCSGMLFLTNIGTTLLTKLFVAAFFHLVRGQGQDLHDDVQAVAERPAGQGEPVHS